MTTEQSTDPVDCAIVGAGPAGLTAALYLARFRRTVRIFDAAESRAALIPVSHNFPGFPLGISGADLLQRLRAQGLRHGVQVEQARVRGLAKRGDTFVLDMDGQRSTARTVILATGVEDLKPDIANWQRATLSSAVRWCPICDGYEGTDQALALLSGAEEGYRHALFLRTYTERLTFFIQPGGKPLTADRRHELAQLKIRVIEEPILQMRTAAEVQIDLAHGETLSFDAVYPMVGCAPRVELLEAFRPRLDDNNLLWVDEHQSTSIPGLYAAGDVVHALNQMSVGTAHAATAATAVHNRLTPNYR